MKHKVLFLRVDDKLYNEAKAEAAKIALPVSTYIRMVLAEKLNKAHQGEQVQN